MISSKKHHDIIEIEESFEDTIKRDIQELDDLFEKLLKW